MTPLPLLLLWPLPSLLLLLLSPTALCLGWAPGETMFASRLPPMHSTWVSVVGERGGCCTTWREANSYCCAAVVAQPVLFCRLFHHHTECKTHCVNTLCAQNAGINIITSFLDNCVITISPVVDEQQQQQPDVAEEVRQQAEQLKQQQEQQAEAKGPQEQAMQQLQHEAMPPTQELQQLEHPTSPLVEDCITLWLSFWAEVRISAFVEWCAATCCDVLPPAQLSFELQNCTTQTPQCCRQHETCKHMCSSVVACTCTHLCVVVFDLQVHYNSLAPKSSADGSVDDASEDSSSSEDEGGSGRHKLLGSARLGRLFGA